MRVICNFIEGAVFVIKRVKEHVPLVLFLSFSMSLIVSILALRCLLVPNFSATHGINGFSSIFYVDIIRNTLNIFPFWFVSAK